MIHTDLVIDNPNFSIITPTGCNAACGFCFWDRSVPQVEPEEYLETLWDVMVSLPYEFNQVSITGGEPTMLPWLKGILMLVRERFDKVVLTTNAWQLKDHLYMAEQGFINHLNISRHGLCVEDNRKVFNSDKVVTDHDITSMSGYFNHFGIDVTLNCVLPTVFTDNKFIFDYIDYAKRLNANYVAFRKDHSTLDEMGVETEMPKIIRTGGCPACRTDTRLINGMMTNWKYSVCEPSNDLGGIYELVYHQDGRLTSDWAGQNVVDVSDGKYINTLRDIIRYELGGYR